MAAIDELVLSLEALGQILLIEAFADEVFVGGALGGDDGAADVDEREDERCFEPLVLCLDVVGDSVERDVGVESGNHWLGTKLKQGRGLGRGGGHLRRG